MRGSIFILDEAGKFIELEKKEYDSETVLQELLDNYPSLLAGDQINQESPRKWLPVAREAPIPDGEKSNYRWSLDHLFLDQDGIPTLVEVKRSSDTRIRREVVGQMLDYASHSVQYWTADRIQFLFENYCENNGKDPEVELREFLVDGQIDDYWQKVKTNLQAKRIRLVFVADAIPLELARVVEFLNEQMDPAEVLAIEVKQYVKGSLKTFVPRVIGQTAHAVGKMARSGGRETEWTIDEVLADIEQRFGEDYYSVAKKLIEWSNNNMTRITGGRGKFDGSLYPVYENDGIAYYPFILWAYGRIEMQFQFLKKEGPFVAIALREELLNMLNMIDGIDMPPDSIERRPAFNLSVIADDPNFNKFIEIIEWIKRKVNS